MKTWVFPLVYIPGSVILEAVLIHKGVLPYRYGLMFQTVCMILLIPLWAMWIKWRER